MPEESLLSLKQLAAELGLPESTVRYYRDAFLDHIPSVGSGRRRRYPPQAVAVLRSIAESYGAGHSRAEVVARIHGDGATAVAVPAGKAAPRRPIDDVTNLDLLAAILDGEREQRDALWQMAKEIVRLTGVLEGQDAVLNQIADRAGVPLAGRLSGGRHPAPGGALAPGRANPPEVATIQPPTVAPTMMEAVEQPAPVPPAESTRPLYATAPPDATSAARPVAAPHAAPAPVTAPGPAHASASAPPSAPAAAAATSGAPSDMEQLRAELEAERQLVERLREAKLQLEHRAAGAEAELEDRGRRTSVIRRILGGDGA